MNPYPFILESLKEAGALLMRLRAETFEIGDKNGDPRDIVTSIDFAVNDLLIERIRAAFPNDSIHSEETLAVNKPGTRVWAIDPIDGSSNFSRGIPHFAICLGLLEDGECVAGGVYNPVTDELFSMKRGEGAYLNGERITVSKRTELKDCFVLFHAGRQPDLQEWGGQGYRTLLANAKKTSNLASTALDTCFVAAGRVEASIYGTFSTMDIAAAVGILREAGGVLADAEGNTVGYTREVQKTYAANSPQVLEALRALV